MHAADHIITHRAIVRPPAACYADCLRADPTTIIDVAKARSQHAGYCEALIACGVELIELDARPDLPDACFVEDTAVILGNHAVITRPGAPERGGETASVASAMETSHRCRHLEAGSLDGGDVLVLDRTIFVGRSGRTDTDGIAALRVIAEPLGYEIRPIPFGDGLHLKSFVTPIGTRAVVLCPGPVGAEAFAGCEVCTVSEPHGGNVLALNGHAIVSAQAPRTANMLADRGLHVHCINVSEFHAGDAGLTCLSLLL